MAYKNILLIDDDADDQEIFLAALEEVPVQVSFTAMSSAIEALDKLTTKRIGPDVIFLDLNMPVMNGQEFLLEIKKRDGLKHIPVIIISTSANKTTIQLTKQQGALDFITKPSTFDELIGILQSILVV